MKRRILSRSATIETMAAMMLPLDRNSRLSDRDQMELAHFSAMCYMIADGQTVKVYEDKDLGGTVVEWL